VPVGPVIGEKEPFRKYLVSAVGVVNSSYKKATAYSNRRMDGT